MYGCMYLWTELLKTKKKKHPNKKTQSEDGRSFSENALHFSARHECLRDTLEWLLAEGSIDPNECSNDEWRRTALIIAVRNGNIDALRALLSDSRVDTDAANAHGGTALIYAAYYNHPSMVDLLLEHGCDPTIRLSNGDSAFDIAQKKGHSQVLNLLQTTMHY